ncbi:MAG TPA: hypothetical protein VM889_06345 [Candidatus Thermoplasmatota archaeon]|nr:hypothetical protein [Candidatus Thermoplasmatota archaeon]
MDRRILTALAACLTVAGFAAPPVFAATHHDMSYESNEPLNIQELENNNLPLANPSASTLILDDYYAVNGLFGSTWNPFSVDPEYYNYQRASGGILPDIITPGLGMFYAFYGYWTDADEDGSLRYWNSSSLGPAEYTLAEGQLFSYVEPGSYPAVDSNGRPNATTYDFSYIVSLSIFDDDFQYEAGQGLGSWFHDGSLLRSLRVQTVANPLLAPDPVTGNPFTCNEGCMIDVDAYNAMAPGPISGPYSSIVGPIIDDFLPTVGFSSLNVPPGFLFVLDAIDEATEPADPVFEAVGEITGPVVNPQIHRISPTYENETHAANNSVVGKVGIDAYGEDWHVYFDARIERVTGWGVYSNSATMANVENTHASAGPGAIAVGAILGIAKDLNGNKRLATNTWASTFDTGEFKGTCIRGGNDFTGRLVFSYTIVPKTPWPTPIFRVPTVFIEETSVIEAGSTTPLVGTVSCYVSDEAAGTHSGDEHWYFPAGAPEMVLSLGTESTPAGHLKFAQGPINVQADFWDQDTYAAWL